MKKKKISLLLRCAIFAVPVAAIFWNCGGTPKANVVTARNLSQLSWQVPVEVFDTTQVDYAILGWQSFIALNWPADTSYRGKPDTTKRIGAGTPVVWETFRLKEETFYPDSATNPGQWNAQVINGKSRRAFAHKSLFRAAKSFDTIPADPAGGEFNEAGVDYPLIDQDSNYVMYEIALNESEYTYVVNHQYYNGNVQKRQIHAGTFVNPPKCDTLPLVRQGDSLYYQIAPSFTAMGLPAFAQYGATEVKASWRVLPANMPSTQMQRYYHRTSVIALPGGGYGTAEVGLVGLHILRLSYITRNTWYWATFEQVDNLTVPSGANFKPSFNPGGNPSYTYGYSYNGCDTCHPAEITNSLPPHPTPVNVSRYAPIPAYIDSLNTVYQNLLYGSVWQYYKMVGVVNQLVGTGQGTELPFPSGNNIYTNVSLMTNATLETYMQNQSNCVTCHSFGFPQHYTSDTATVYANNQIFTFLLSDASTTGATLSEEASKAILRKQRMRGHK